MPYIQRQLLGAFAEELRKATVFMYVFPSFYPSALRKQGPTAQICVKCFIWGILLLKYFDDIRISAEIWWGRGGGRKRLQNFTYLCHCYMEIVFSVRCDLRAQKRRYANCELREKTNKMQQLDVYYQYFLNMFRASLCPSSGDQDVCYCTRCAALVLLDVVGSGCGAQSNSNLHSARTLQRSAPQPLPATSNRTSAAHRMQ